MFEDAGLVDTCCELSERENHCTDQIRSEPCSSSAKKYIHHILVPDQLLYSSTVQYDSVDVQ